MASCFPYWWAAGTVAGSLGAALGVALSYAIHLLVTRNEERADNDRR